MRNPLLWAGVIIAFACKNEIVSLILLACLTVWGVLKLMDEMSKGGFK